MLKIHIPVFCFTILGASLKLDSKDPTVVKCQSVKKSVSNEILHRCVFFDKIMQKKD